MAFPPTPTLAIASCPAVKAYTDHHLPDAGTLTSPAYVQGGTLHADDLNETATRADLQGRYGGGIWGVVPGPSGTFLNLSAGAGLTLNIAAGTAIMDGEVSVSATSVVLTANIARAFIWLSVSGSVAVVNNSTTPPAGSHVLLGSAVTDASSITSVDFSGVVYLNGPVGAVRYNSGSSTPTDTPPTNVSFYQKQTGDGSWWRWTGSEWVQEYGGATSAEISVFSVAAANGTVTVNAANSHSSVIEITAGTATDAWIMELTVAGSPAIPAGWVWTISNQADYPVTIRKVGSADTDVFLCYKGRGQFEYNNNTKIVPVSRDLARYQSYAISGTFNPDPSETDADLLSVSSVGANTMNLPTSIAPEGRGRIRAVHASVSQSALTVQASGETDAHQITVLLPGEVQGFVQGNDGSQDRLVTRPYTQLVTHNMASDANYTVTSAQALGFILRITDTGPLLTAGRNIVMPLTSSKLWYVLNGTAQTLTFIGATGTGTAVGAGKLALLFSDGTNIVGGVFP